MLKALVRGKREFWSRELVLVVVLALKVACPVYIQGDNGNGSSMTTVSKGGSPYHGHGMSDSVRGKKSSGSGAKGAWDVTGRRRMDKTIFREDFDISWYLKVFNRKLMIWRCRNAIQVPAKVLPLPSLDVSCSVIGHLWSVSWLHGNKKIASQTGKIGDAHPSGRYSLSVTPHIDSQGRSFSNWKNIRLSIYNATSRDSGVYTVTVKHFDGPTDRQKIYVDIE